MFKKISFLNMFTTVHLRVKQNYKISFLSLGMRFFKLHEIITVGMTTTKLKHVVELLRV